MSEEEAAVKIQAVQRGREQRKDMEKVQEAKKAAREPYKWPGKVDENNPSVAMKDGEEGGEAPPVAAPSASAPADAAPTEGGDAPAGGGENKEMSEEEAAVKIQAVQRGREQRKDMEKVQEAKKAAREPYKWPGKVDENNPSVAIKDDEEGGAEAAAPAEGEAAPAEGEAAPA